MSGTSGSKLEHSRGGAGICFLLVVDFGVGGAQVLSGTCSGNIVLVIAGYHWISEGFWLF